MIARRAAAAAIAGLLAAAPLACRRPRPLHVFVNETADHRFDESIQVSILAGYKRAGVQNAVVITDRFPPERLEEEAHRLFARLELGRAARGRAILYLFSPKHKALKIEVGYALEPVMPDAQLHFLEEAAKTFTYADRYQDFWAELLNTVNMEIQRREAGRSRGLWRVEEPLSWSLFQRFEDSNRVFLKYPLELRTPEGRSYLPRVFGEPLYLGPAVRPADLFGASIRGDALRYAYFRLFRLDRAARELERTPPDDPDRLSIAADVYQNLGRFSLYLDALKRLSALRPQDRRLARDYAYLRSKLRFTGPQWRLSLDEP